ncbi:anti-sigma factor domain-containing protein [Cupriavidus pauculus]|uniref:anti-sigma factor n=1 Tax=Cupriavidus pauculus TaxID=82633 RepID=UPI001EE34B3F|nr:anti-sigma factor [Cupriavidus pauculus]GJG97573.1 RNA polymerase subunit sigma-70 [Cupriavidus pauculus]
MSIGTPGPDDRTPGDAQDQLAAEYVLGTLPQSRREEIQQRMRTDAVFAGRVRDWENRLDPLTALAEPVQPSATLWHRIAASVGLRAPRRDPALRWWGKLALWRGLALGATACALVLAVLLGWQAFAPPAGPRFVVILSEPRDRTPGWLIQASSDRKLSLISIASQSAPSDRSLQFWTKADDWAGPVSLGLVRPGQRLDIPIDKLPPLQPNQLFEITLEPPAGSPTGRPTGPILYIGRAIKVG